MQFYHLRDWNIQIQNSTRRGFFLKTLDLYSSLLKSSFHGDRLTFPFVLKACAQLASLCSGRRIHTHVILLGFLDVFVQTSLLDMYAKCSSLSDARQVFDEMPNKTAVSWNSIISAYAKAFLPHESFRLFNAMRSSSLVPTSSTCVSLVSGCCSSTAALRQGTSVHCYGIKFGFFSDLQFQNSILGLYVRFNSIDDANFLFDSMKQRSAVTYATIISSCVKLGDCFKAFELFNRMRLGQISLDAIVFINLASSCALLGRLLTASSLLSLLIRSNMNSEPNIAASTVNMFSKCGDIVSARKVFDAVIEKKNALLWTSMICGYVRAGNSRTALDLFEDMMRTGISPNRITFVTILSACASLGLLSASEQVIEHINAFGLESDLQIQTSLIHLYSKCGSLDRAREIFNAISHKDLAAWSSMINCYAFNGKGEESVALFKEMLKDRSIELDAVVFTNVLSACNHSGLVEEGMKWFISMQLEYGIEASKEHYSCMVDLLCKAGYFDSSLEFILQAPVELRRHVWAPFLSALRTSGGVNYVNKFTKELDVEGEGTGNQVLLASISSSLGKWKEARDLRALIDKRGLSKEAGWSRTELCR